MKNLAPSSSVIHGLDRRWADAAAVRVLPDIGAAVLERTGVDPDSPAGEAFADALIDAFDAGVQEWNAELQARLIEAGLDLKLHEGTKPRTSAAGATMRRGRLVQTLATRTSTDPTIVARMFTAMVLLPMLAAVVAWLWLNGAAQVLVLVACALWLGVLGVAHLRATPAAPTRRPSER